MLDMEDVQVSVHAGKLDPSPALSMALGNCKTGFRNVVSQFHIAQGWTFVFISIHKVFQAVYDCASRFNGREGDLFP